LLEYANNLLFLPAKINSMTELEKCRENIDHIDKELIDLLARRFRYAERIGQIKREQGISVLQAARWDNILSSRREDAIKAGLSEMFTRDFLQLVHSESIRIQEGIAGGK
jgi:chorismate mutase